MTKEYKIGGKIYRLKDEYSLKEWGKILKIMSDAGADEDKALIVTINLMAGGALEEVLNLMLDRDIESELMESDVEEVERVITDFFSRKNALTNATKESS